MKSHAIFREVNTEVGQIIVADIIAGASRSCWPRSGDAGGS
jgi:hypothetical protein